MKQLLRHRRVQSFLIRLFAWYLEMTLRSKRWTVDGAEHLAACRAGASGIIVFWHELLPLMPELLRDARRRPGYAAPPVHILVSRHNDGRFISAIMNRFGTAPIFGSSSRGGAAAMQVMVRLLRSRAVIAITPDGPRGPARQAAAGVVQLAALAGVPIFPCGAAITHGPRLATWDRMYLPLPFGRGVLTCRPPIIVPRDNWREALPHITTEMNAAMARAEALCTT